MKPHVPIHHYHANATASRMRVTSNRSFVIIYFLQFFEPLDFSHAPSPDRDQFKPRSAIIVFFSNTVLIVVVYV